MTSIVEFYNQYNEDFRFQRNSRKIEFLTSLQALDPFINQPTKIVELGAGAGAYSLYYALGGHEVTAIDLVEFNINQINNKKNMMGNIALETIVADASNLTMLSNNSYDVVLCLGPYYHIIDESKRKSLISECIRVLKPQGILAIAYLNKYSVLPMLVKKQPEFFNTHIIDQVINKGYIVGDDSRSFWIDSHYTSPKEIEHYIGTFDVDIIDHLATDGLSHTLSEEVDALDEATFELYCRYHEQTCRERSILGISAHGLLIVRKR